MTASRAALLFLVAAGGAAVGCQPGTGARTLLQYTPRSPVSIAWDSTGAVSLVGERRLVTCLGVFEFCGAADLVAAEAATLVMLRDPHQETERIYRVESGEDFSIDDPSSVTVRAGRVIVEVIGGASKTIRFGTAFCSERIELREWQRAVMRISRATCQLVGVV